VDYQRILFLANYYLRDAMLAQYLLWKDGWLAGWLAGWLSHAGIVSKRLNVS